MVLAWVVVRKDENSGQIREVFDAFKGNLQSGQEKCRDNVNTRSFVKAAQPNRNYL